jgi:hypothetical protein
VFCSAEFLGDNRINSIVLGATGKSQTLTYNSGRKSNVISYSWQWNFSDSGSNVMPTHMADGSIQMKRYSAATQSIVTYKFNPDAIDNSLKGLSIEDETKLLADYALQYRWEDALAKKIFVAVPQETAPEGYGYTANIQCLGNPLFFTGNKVLLGSGFPAVLGGKDSVFYIRKASHKIGMDGYKTDLEIVDGYTLTQGTGVILE